MTESHKTIVVSFIIPVYRVEEEYLRQCIESLLRIKCHDVEYIFVDDGSPDDAGEICDEYKTKDSRIVVVHKSNGGVSKARNIGIDIAQGEYITFIDADDWIDSDVMDEILLKVKKLEYDLYIYGQYINYRNKQMRISPFDEDRSFVTERDFLGLKQMLFVRGFDDLFFHLESGVICNCVDKFIRKSVIESNGLRYNENIVLGEDNLLNLQLLFCYKNAYYINKCCYHYRMRESSANHIFRGLGYGEHIDHFVREAEHILNEHEAPEVLFNALYYRCFNLIFEQLDRAYIKVENINIVKKCIYFDKELQRDPYNKAIMIIDSKYLTNKEKIIRNLFKHRMAGLYLFYKIVKIHLNTKKEKRFY